MMSSNLNMKGDISDCSATTEKSQLNQKITSHGQSSNSSNADTNPKKNIGKVSQFFSGKELLLGNLCDGMMSSPINYHAPGINPTRKSSIDTIDSGISSPTSLMTDNIRTKERRSSIIEIGIDTLDYQSQLKSLNSKPHEPLPKLSACDQSHGGIGGIVSRIRSLSIGMRPRFYSSGRRQSDEGYVLSSEQISLGCVSPAEQEQAESVKTTNPSTNSAVHGSNKSSRFNRKWMQISHSLSNDAESFHEYPQNKNRMEIFLSGHIDTSTPNGALLAVINQGLRKVSESDRYLLFSKCPLRSPIDFLDSGMEHLGNSDILITVLHHSTCYDLMPESGKLIVLDSNLSINKAFNAIEDNNVDSAPIWHYQEQSFIGKLSKDNQMYFLLLAYQFRELSLYGDSYMDSISRESLFNCIEREPTRHLLQWVNPEDTLCSVIKCLEVTGSSEVLVVDRQRSGNALYLLNHRRILTFLLSASLYGLPLPSVLKNTVGVTELMMSRAVLERHKVYPTTNLSTLLNVMDSNGHHCAIVCTQKVACKTCLCTDECIGLLTVDHISQLISQSRHSDPCYKVEFILNRIPQSRKNLIYCSEREPVINIIKSIIKEKTQFILINQDCCRNCIHSIISSKELLNYIMKHDVSSAIRENTYVPEHRRTLRSLSCCETVQRIPDKNILRSGQSLDEKEEDVFNMEVT